MSTRRSRPANFQIPPGADDFSSAIKGIGPGIAQRLYGAEILTFEQLAVLSPNKILARIGNQPGLSISRIAEEDWAGQARAMAAEKSTTHELEIRKELAGGQAIEDLPASEVPSDNVGNHPRYATFTVELLLGKDGDVRKTSVAHIQSGHIDLQKLCSGWDSVRLVKYIAEHAGLRIDTPSQSTVRAVTTEKPAVPVQLEYTGRPILHELSVVPIGGDRPHNVLSHDLPFHVRLALGFTYLVMSPGQPISYTAIVLAKRMGSGVREHLGQVRGQILPSKILDLDFAARSLSQGLYRLEAVISLSVMFDTPNSEPTQRTEVTGGLLQIY